MGFDNECILNIQSLPGEYFCPVCRTLIFPNEALQSQCTHLYCKPCLAYVVATTHACPYDGYLVTEADSKPLIESNKALAETIGKVQVYCLYHRSGCQWHGTLSDCINHCTGCSFGNSPVVCNRCGTQIVHRQVQEHAQTCPGLQPQGQQADNGQVQASTGQDATQDSSAVASSVTTAAPLTAAVTVSTASAMSSVSASATTPAAAPAATAVVQSQNQGLAVAYPQAGVQAPTAEQWYQQQQQLQYQQYYQQYPGYDPYQQQYQQYGQYQQQAYQQFTQPHMQVAPQQVNTGQQQTQPFMQVQPQVQTHPQLHAQSQVQPQAQGIQPQLQPQPVPQPLPQPQPQPQPQPHPQSQLHAHPQPQLQTQPLSHAQFPQAQHIPVQQAQQAVQPQVNPQPTQVSAHLGHPQFTQLQPYPQAQQSSQIHPQQYQPAVQSQQLSQPTIQHQQPLPQSQLRPMNPTQGHLYNQPQAQFQQHHMLQQPRPLPQPQPQALPQPQAQPQPQPQPQTQHPSVHGVSGHQSYPQPQAVQQIPLAAPQQRPMHPQQPGAPQQASQVQYPIPQLQQLRPPPTHMPMQAQQYPAMQPHAQAPFPNAALQPQALQLAHQPGQHMHHPPGMQPHPQQQALPQQQAQGHLPSSQLSQQGAFPTQPPPHSQQSLRPQVQSYTQPQLNVPPVQGRTVLPNQAVSQQGQLSPAKPIQSGMNQQTPLTRQHGSFQQSQLSHSGGQNSLAPAAPPHSGADAAQISEAGSDLKSAVLEKPENSVLDKASQMQQLEVEAATGNADASEKSRSSDHVIPKHDGDSKSLIDRKPPTDTVNEKSETKENKDDSVLNQVKGPAEDFHDGKERPHASTTVVDEVQRTEGNQNEKSVAMVGVIAESSDGPNAAQLPPVKNKQVEMADQGNVTRGQSVGIAASSMQVLQQMPHGQLPRDGSQLPPPQSGSVSLHGIPPAAPPNERFPPHNIPYGHPPSMADPSAVVSQRPSAPDRMFPQNIPQVGSSQERRFQESFPHQISMHGPATVPGQLRPPGYSENLGYPGQPPVMAETFQPPGAKQPYSSNLLQKNIDEINPFPLQNQSYRPPPHVSGIGAGQIDPLSRPVISGPPPGAFDAPSGLIARGPNFGSEDQVGRSGPVNLMEGHGYYDGRMPESHRPLSGEHPPYGQQVNSNMKMNGGKGPGGVMHDSAFSHGVPDDRFRPLPGERFKPLPEEGFRTQAEKFGPMTADPGRHIANRREFDEDFKHFPRPGHLDVDQAHRFSMYGSTGRPLLDRGQQFGTDGGPWSYDRASLGSFPPYPPGGRFPPSSSVSEHGTLEIVDRQRGPLFNEDLTGKHEAVVHPERLRSFPEFGRPHFDSIPPIRSPGIPDASRRFLMEPGHLRKEIEAFDVSHTRLHAGDHVGHGLANNVRGGEPYGARNIPGHQRFGDSVGHAPLRGGEQIGFGGYGRKPVGDSGFSNSYPVHGSLSLDVDSFEHLRKRKHGSMGWCRICKIDCDTVEGLEVHSQTKDHQNMAMEIVLSIKKENAKKQKLTSEESEETNKSRKKSFENHGGRR